MTGGLALAPRLARERLSSSGEFVFARLRYESGDWDYNPKVCSNVLDAIVQYTSIPVRQDEVVITLDSPDLQSFPFLFMTGHKLVRFSEKERQGLVRYVENGGLLFSDDCNHDVNGLYAKSFEAVTACNPPVDPHEWDWQVTAFQFNNPQCYRPVGATAWAATVLSPM